MTFFGKLLVLATVLGSFVFLGLAAGVYLNSPNWGWDPKEARKEFGTVIPSEIDKRKPIISELAQARGRAKAALADAKASLAKVEADIPKLQLQYSDELTRIRSGAGMTQKQLLDAKPWLFDVKTKKPLFQFGDIEKSYLEYSRQLTKLLDESKKKQEEVETVIKEEKDLTEQLNGKMNAMGKREKGLYALAGLEEETRKRAEEELEELRPAYYEELALSQLLQKRQASLKSRVEELKTTGSEKPKN
jgi:hypothetical protein